MDRYVPQLVKGDTFTSKTGNTYVLTENARQLSNGAYGAKMTNGRFVLMGGASSQRGGGKTDESGGSKKKMTHIKYMSIPVCSNLINAEQSKRFYGIDMSAFDRDELHELMGCDAWACIRYHPDGSVKQTYWNYYIPGSPDQRDEILDDPDIVFGNLKPHESINLYMFEDDQWCIRMYYDGTNDKFIVLLSDAAKRSNMYKIW